MSKRSSEKLSLLISYLSLVGIWFAIPSITLLIDRDNRWPYAVLILSCIIILFFIAYIFDWKVLFPKTTDELIYENENEHNLKNSL